MARRTSAQNAPIYRRRAERAEAQGTTYGKIKYAQSKTRLRGKVEKIYKNLGVNDTDTKQIVDGLTPAQQKQVTDGAKARELANTPWNGGRINPFWYHDRIF